MDSHTTVTAITIGGLAVSCVGAVISQVWKDSIEIQGRITKQLTPAGRLSLGIAFIGLAASVASQLISANIDSNERLQKQNEDAQKKALQAQEEKWREATSSLLGSTKSDIETNLGKTIAGFSDEQDHSIRVLREIALSQPLTSLKFQMAFTSSDHRLWQMMKTAQDQIEQNADSAQGGVPEVPYAMEEYADELLPLIRFIARIGDPKGHRSTSYGTKGNKISTDSVAVLLPLDDSHNAVLAFGYVNPAAWDTKGDQSNTPALPVGFGPMAENDDIKTRHGNSTPDVITILAKTKNNANSKYTIRWNLDPETLSNAIDRVNATIAPTGNLPAVLRIVILYDMADIPFGTPNFANSSAANLWGNDLNARDVNFRRKLGDVKLTLVVNGLNEMPHKYILKRMYKIDPVQDADDEPLDVGCAVLQFETEKVAPKR